MSFTFIYESENKKLKSFEKRDDLVLKEVRFKKKIPPSKTRKDWKGLQASFNSHHSDSKLRSKFLLQFL